MILDKRKLDWIKSNQVIIGEILAELIDDKKNEMVNEEDDEKREKARNWVKDLKLGLITLERCKQKEYEKKLSGI